ncbi:hypothetical protein HY251_03840 [bacterium]|nr:hypothetical protein [bacterium]
MKHKTDEAFKAFLKDGLDKELPDAKAGAISRAYARLGLLPARYELKKELVAMLAGQALAYYDPNLGTFFVVKVGLPDMLVGPAMLHELGHALQDQRFDLKKYYGDVEKGDEDAKNARKFVVEGEATYLMLAYALKQQGMDEGMLGTIIDQYGNMSREQMSGLEKQQAGALGEDGKAIADAAKQRDALPLYLYRSLIDPYFKGAILISKVKEKGGWKAVDELFTNPPTSTHQVLHPDKFVDRREEPVVLSLPDLGSVLGDGWKRSIEDCLGELGAASALAEAGAKDREVNRATRGWRGDRFQAYEKDEKSTVTVWLSTWDREKDATEFETVWNKVREEKKGEPESLVFRKDKDVVLVEGAPEGKAQALADAALEKVQRKEPAVKTGEKK